MRVGYRKAQFRFQGLDLRRLSDVYFKVSQKLKELVDVNTESEIIVIPRAEQYRVSVRYMRPIFKFQS
jgi:hypothetical protein